MPIDFGSLEADRRTITVPFGDDVLSVTYQPSLMTPDVEGNYEILKQRGMHAIAMARRLGHIVVEWDAEFDGEPITPDADGFGRLGYLYLSRIDDAINVDFTEARKMTSGS